MNKAFGILKEYREIISYLFFGGCTTLINIVVYFVCYNILSISNVVSTIIAWIISVVFAFVTNKLYVFNSKNIDLRTILKEAVSFFSCRIATGVLDVVIMYVTVDLLSFNSLLWKIISNVLVIVLNYIFSKLFIFKNNKVEME